MEEAFGNVVSCSATLWAWAKWALQRQVATRRGFFGAGNLCKKESQTPQSISADVNGCFGGEELRAPHYWDHARIY